MTKKTRNQRIDTVFVLLIFCIFAVSVLMVLMFSASTYKNMTDISRENYDQRTALSFIWTKVKTNDEGEGIFIDTFKATESCPCCSGSLVVPALCFDSTVDSTTYRTMIYHYDGWVYELYCEKGVSFDHGDGVAIIELDELIFEDVGDGLIKIASGGSSLMVYPQSGTMREMPAQ